MRALQHRSHGWLTRGLAAPFLCLLLSAQALAAGAAPAGGGREGEDGEERQVMATLEAMAKATIDRDVPTLERIYHDDLTYNHSTGMTQNKAQVLKDIPRSTFATMRFSEPRIRFYGPVAVVKVTTDLQYSPQGTLVDRHLNQMFVMLKGPQGWRIVAKHTTRILP